MKVVFLFTGLLLGACIVATVLCCVQINRLSEYERRIQRLRDELNKRN